MLVSASALLLAAALAPPQEVASRRLVEPFSEPSLVRGSVRTAAGEPLPPGAVDARFELVPSTRFARETVLEALRSTPLPPLRVAADGGLVLPLTGMHRARLGAELGDWWLVVEAEGHLPWRQELPLGLAGLVSIDVSLTPVTPSETVSIDLGDPSLGAAGGVRTVLTRHWLRQRAGGRVETWSLESRTIGADQERCEVLALSAPCPSIWGGEELREWGVQVLVLDHASGTLRAADVEGRMPGPPEFEIVAEAGEAEPLTVVAPGLDGGPARGAVVALQGPGDLAFQLTLPEGGPLRVPDGYRVRWVSAPGHRARELQGAARSGEVELTPLDAEGQAPLRVAVRQVDDAPLVGAWVVVEPLELMLGSAPIRVPPPRSLFRGRTDVEGRVEIPAGALTGPIQLRVDAVGCELAVCTDPRPASGAPESVVVPPPLQAEPFAVTVLDTARGPVSQALVLQGSRGGGGTPQRARVARTDSEGRVELPGDSGGHGRLTVLADGHLPHTDSRVDLSAGAAELVVTPCRTLGLVVVDEEGMPVAGAHVQEPNRRGTSEQDDSDLAARPFWTDVRGRSWFRIPVDAEVIGISHSLFSSHTQTAQLDARGGFVEFTIPRLRSLRIVGGPEAWFARLARIRGGGASTGGVTEPGEGPRSGVFLARWQSGQELELRIGPGVGRTLRITDAGVEVGEASGRGFVTLDHRQPRRRIPLQIDIEDGGPAVDLRLARVEFRSPHFGGELYSNAMGDQLSVDDQGQAWLELWDPSAATLHLLHPDLQVAELKIGSEVAAGPGEGGGDEGQDGAADDPAADTVHVSARRGARVTLRLSVDSAGPRPTYLTISPAEGRGSLRFQELLTVTEADAARGHLDWVVPAGLAAGSYQVSGRGGIGAAEQDFEVGEDLGSLLVDLHDAGEGGR